MTEAIRGVLVAPGDTRQPGTAGEYDRIRLSVAGFLAGYTGHTRRGYETDLRLWGDWCADMGLEPFHVQRPHIELYLRSMEEAGKAKGTVARRIGTIAGWYRYCEEEEIIEKSPARHVRRPKVSMESTTLGLDRNEMGAFLSAAQLEAAGPRALVNLLSINGLRVSEACNADIEGLSIERGHRVLHIIGKGDKPAVIALPPRVARAIDMAIDGRMDGPIFLRPDGQRLDRHCASRWVRRIARDAGITKRISPHSLRHSFVTAALDAGVPLRDVQEGARHADPRTTMRYDRARHNLDRHCSYVVAAFVAGGG